MAIVEAQPTSGEERFLLTDISWDFYLRFCDELEERRIRLTYDQGRLELMITKARHEYYKTMIARLVEQLLLELGMPVRSGGSMTFQRADLRRGFEPDECWWIAHEREVRGKSEFDFRHDPPPDLAVEVEISRSLVNRVGIYAAIGVPELWRHDGRQLRFFVLTEEGTYCSAPTSLTFPFLRPAHLEPFLKLDEDVDETTRVRRFVDWFRRQGFAAPRS